MAGDVGFVVLMILGVIVFGTLNNFGGKMKAETMGTFNFVTGLVDNWVHLAVTGLIVAVLVARGSVTRPQLARVFRFGKRWADNGLWKYIAIASVLDVANSITGLASQPYLTALMMSLMDQTTTPFTVVTSFVMMGTRYTALETCSVLVILCAAIGAVLVVEEESSGDNSAGWAIFAAATTSFAAVSYVLKEMSFREYAADRASTGLAECLNHSEEPTEQSTNSASSISERTAALRAPAVAPAASAAAAAAAQTAEGAPPLLPETLSVFLVSLIVSFGGSLTCVPVALITRVGTSKGDPVQAMKEGFHCLATCENAIPAYVFSTVVNYCFNFCLLALTGRGSALLAFVSLKVVVPCTALCSPLPWPLIGSKTVSSELWGILGAMLLALAGFRYGNIERERLGLRRCCWPLCGGASASSDEEESSEPRRQ